MSLTRNASANLVPLLSRLVLAAAFIPAGSDKIMGEPVRFEGQEAETLQRPGAGEDAARRRGQARQAGARGLRASRPPLADPARPPGLHRAQAPLRGMQGQRPLRLQGQERLADC